MNKDARILCSFEVPEPEVLREAILENVARLVADLFEGNTKTAVEYLESGRGHTLLPQPVQRHHHAPGHHLDRLIGCICDDMEKDPSAHTDGTDGIRCVMHTFELFCSPAAALFLVDTQAALEGALVVEKYIEKPTGTSMFQFDHGQFLESELHILVGLPVDLLVKRIGFEGLRGGNRSPAAFQQGGIEGTESDRRGSNVGQARISPAFERRLVEVVLDRLCDQQGDVDITLPGVIIIALLDQPVDHARDGQ